MILGRRPDGYNEVLEDHTATPPPWWSAFREIIKEYQYYRTCTNHPVHRSHAAASATKTALPGSPAKVEGSRNAVGSAHLARPPPTRR